MTTRALEAIVVPQPESPRHRRWQGWLVRGLFVAVGLGVLARFLHEADLGAARRLVVQVGWPLVFVLVPTAVMLALDARGLQLVLATLGQRVKWRAVARLRVGVEAMVLGVPGGGLAGEAAKAALLRRSVGVPLPIGAAAQAISKTCHVGAEAIYLTFAAAALVVSGRAGPLGPAWGQVGLCLAGAALTTGIVVGLFYVLNDTTMAARLGRWLHVVPIARVRRWAATAQSSFEEADRSCARFFRAPLGARVRCLPFFVAEWLVEGVETWIILRCLGSHLPVAQILALDGVGSLVRALVFFVPAGLGFQDATSIALLSASGVPHAATLGIALSFIKRTKEGFWMLTGALILAATSDAWRSETSRPTE
jgi:uncharacterized membrane protein YbhN (UPF0104 family)